MYLQDVSMCKVEAITGKLSGVRISKDEATSWDRPISRIAERLDETLSEWRTLRLRNDQSH
jgi:hypothetical protein